MTGCFPARVLGALAAAVLLLAGCDQGARPPADAYDVGKMDLKPVPARIHAGRHQGAFAEGGALSTGAELKPLDPAPGRICAACSTSAWTWSCPIIPTWPCG